MVEPHPRVSVTQRVACIRMRTSSYATQVRRESRKRGWQYKKGRARSMRESVAEGSAMNVRCDKDRERVGAQARRVSEFEQRYKQKLCEESVLLRRHTK